MAIERRLTKIEALRQIAAMTNADDAESYRADDREGCLDTVFAVAVDAIKQDDDLVKTLLDALVGIVEIGRKDTSSAKYDGYYEDAANAIAEARIRR